MNSFKLFFATLFIVATIVSGCKKDDVTAPAPNPTTSTYVGTVGGGTETGSLSVNVTVGKTDGTTGGITGTLRLAGPPASTITLTGTFANNAFSISGGGFTFTGTLAGGIISGTYTGPNGGGGFSLQVPTNGTQLEIYLGTATSQVPGHTGARLNLGVNGATLRGIAVGYSDGNVTQLMGTIAGGTVDVRATDAPTIPLATGTKTDSTWSGTYSTPDGDHGVWSATRFR